MNILWILSVYKLRLYLRRGSNSTEKIALSYLNKNNLAIEINRVIIKKDITKVISTELNKLNSDKKLLLIFDKNISGEIIENIFSFLKLSGFKIYVLKLEGSKKNKNEIGRCIQKIAKELKIENGIIKGDIIVKDNKVFFIENE